VVCDLCGVVGVFVCVGRCLFVGVVVWWGVVLLWFVGEFLCVVWVVVFVCGCCLCVGVWHVRCGCCVGLCGLCGVCLQVLVCFCELWWVWVFGVFCVLWVCL
jgi:hypothetical protein